MRGVIRDVRYALRYLAKHPSFAATALMSFALGIGACTLVFSVIYASLFRPLPYRDADHLVELASVTQAGCGECWDATSQRSFGQWLHDARSFSGLAAHRTETYVLRGAGDPRRVTVEVVGGPLFSLLGVRPFLGRSIVSSDDQAGAEPVAVLGYRLWRQSFAAEPRTIGRSVTLNGRPYSVVGVMPPGVRFPGAAEAWIPIASAPSVDPDVRAYLVVARLKPGISLAAARAEMAVLGSRGALADTASHRAATAFCLSRQSRAAATSALWVLTGAVAFSFLIALANLASLYLVRALARGRELAVRAALGAGMGRIARQLITESLVVAALGGIGGVLVAFWGRDLLVALSPDRLGILTDTAIDARILAFAFLLSAVSGILVSLAPLCHFARADVQKALQGGGTVGSRRRGRTRSILIAAEVACAVVLAWGTGVLAKSFAHLQRADVGFDADRLVVATLDLGGTRYGDPAQALSLARELVTRLDRLPGAAGATAWSTVRPSTLVRPGVDPVTLEGRSERLGPRSIPIRSHDVTQSFFRAVGIPVVRGRAFDAADESAGSLTIVINEEAARRWWPGEDALGKRLKLGPPDAPTPWLTVVGVVANTHPVDEWGLWTARNYPDRYYPLIFRPLAQVAPRELTVGVRARGDAHRLARTVRAEIRAAAPELLVEHISTLREAMLSAPILRDVESNARLLGWFALLGVGLALMGIYGVISNAVVQRTREIGLRAALGASPRHIRWIITREGVGLALAGTGAGCIGVVSLSRVLERLLFGVTEFNRQGLLFGTTSTDSAVFAGVCLAIFGAGFLGSYIPARGATHVDPTVALRAD